MVSRLHTLIRIASSLILEELLLAQRIGGIIVVAIDNTDEFRRKVLNPVKVTQTSPETRIDEYARFIVLTLKPFIDSSFRTLPQRDHTGIAGFSAGAACSVYIGMKYQDVFSKIGAFSLTFIKSFYNTTESDTNTFNKSIFLRKHAMKIYMDIGKMERPGLPGTIRNEFVDDFEYALATFCKRLKGYGFGGDELKCVIDDN